MKFLFGGILLVSQVVLVLMLMLDAWATGFLGRKQLPLFLQLQLFLVDITKTGVVGLIV